MEPWRTFFRGKRITLMGLGLLGRGVGDAAFLAGLGAELTVTDRKSAEELTLSLAALKDFKNITYVLGEHRLEDFTGADMIIKAAGVPLDSPFINAAREAGVPVYMSTALFAKFAREKGATLAGVTGTRGKSTVTHLIYHALMEAGKRALLGGNIRGLSTLALLPEVTSKDIIVLELDSWQLQGFGDLKISPDIAVFTNLMQDHLNYYPNEAAYMADKANIFINQKPQDKLVVGSGIAERIRAMHPPAKAVVPAPIPLGWKLAMLGAHNRDNAALAAEALRALGLSEEEIQKGLESFAGVEGRLQKIASIGGVDIYNDNNSTTPDATIAALKAFEVPIVLIMGGSDKNLPLGDLAEAIRQKSPRIVLLPGSGTDALKPLLAAYQEAGSIAQALDAALSQAPAGGAVLFSPAFASFGLFKNEYDRHDQFLSAIKALRE